MKQCTGIRDPVTLADATGSQKVLTGELSRPTDLYPPPLWTGTSASICGPVLTQSVTACSMSVILLMWNPLSDRISPGMRRNVSRSGQQGWRSKDKKKKREKREKEQLFTCH